MSSPAGRVIPEDLDSALVRLRDTLASERALVVGAAPAQERQAAGPLPFVSVIVLNFNGESVLARCLDCLLGQDYPNYEIIVVDNASSDESMAILESYLPSDKLTVIRSETNRGVPGGRNLGVLHARGEIVAFIDNDGYARADWLHGLVRAFADESVGAAASLVFFARKKIVVNGAGGTLNLGGYGGDHCFRSSFEFSTLPGEVLYPMGCGMAVRRSLVGDVFPIDETIFNYFDDVEVGIRVWNAGKRVVVASGAWIDHAFSTADAIHQNKMYLCERNRIRTVLKFAPVSHLPRWLLHEHGLKRYLGISGLRLLPVRAWLWNLARLPSVLLSRLRMRPRPERYWGKVARTWAQYPPPLPEEHLNSADPREVGDAVVLGTEGDGPYTLYGWFWNEHEDGHPYRWSGREASLLLRASPETDSLALRLRFARGVAGLRVIVRELGSATPIVEHHVPASSPGAWREISLPVQAPDAVCEVILESEATLVDSVGRNLGIGLSRAAFLAG